MDLLMVCVLWTWGLTPAWVNILGTCLVGLSWVIKIADVYVKSTKSDN